MIAAWVVAWCCAAGAAYCGVVAHRLARRARAGEAHAVLAHNALYPLVAPRKLLDGQALDRIHLALWHLDVALRRRSDVTV